VSDGILTLHIQQKVLSELQSTLVMRRAWALHRNQLSELSSVGKLTGHAQSRVLDFQIPKFTQQSAVVYIFGLNR